jgi:hypothetical protein
MKNRGIWRGTILGLFLFYIVPLRRPPSSRYPLRWDHTILPEGPTMEWWQAVTSSRLSA